MDFKKGIDKSDTAGDRTLVDGVKLNIFVRDEEMRGFEFRKDQGNIRKTWGKNRRKKNTSEQIEPLQVSKLQSYQAMFLFWIFFASGLVSMTTLKVAEIFRTIRVWDIVVIQLPSFSTSETLPAVLPGIGLTNRAGLGHHLPLVLGGFFRLVNRSNWLQQHRREAFLAKYSPDYRIIIQTTLPLKKRLGKLNKNTHCFFHD